MHNWVLNKLSQTNNNLGGWHTRFSDKFRRTHPPISEFTDILKLDALHNRMLTAQTLAGAALPQQKRVYRNVNDRIAAIVQGYNNENIILFTFFDFCKTLKFAKLGVLEEGVIFARS